MQTYRIENDVPLFGVEAASFPQGIQQVWQDLPRLLPTTNGRTFYGVSHGTEGGGDLYKACVKEAFTGEAESFGLVPFVLPKGEYTGETIHGFAQWLPKIGEVFQSLLGRDDYDGNGACLEWYLNAADVVCMTRRREVPPASG